MKSYAIIVALLIVACILIEWKAKEHFKSALEIYYPPSTHTGKDGCGLCDGPCKQPPAKEMIHTFHKQFYIDEPIKYNKKTVQRSGEDLSKFKNFRYKDTDQIVENNELVLYNIFNGNIIKTLDFYADKTQSHVYLSNIRGFLGDLSQIGEATANGKHFKTFTDVNLLQSWKFEYAFGRTHNLFYIKSVPKYRSNGFSEEYKNVAEYYLEANTDTGDIKATQLKNGDWKQIWVLEDISIKHGSIMLQIRSAKYGQYMRFNKNAGYRNEGKPELSDGKPNQLIYMENISQKRTQMPFVLPSEYKAMSGLSDYPSNSYMKNKDHRGSWSQHHMSIWNGTYTIPSISHRVSPQKIMIKMNEKNTGIATYENKQYKIRSFGSNILTGYDEGNSGERIHIEMVPTNFQNSHGNGFATELPIKIKVSIAETDGKYKSVCSSSDPDDFGAYCVKDSSNDDMARDYLRKIRVPKYIKTINDDHHTHQLTQFKKPLTEEQKRELRIQEYLRKRRERLESMGFRNTVCSSGYC